VRSGAHVIVVGNEKGGSGKSTTAFHLAVQLLYEGFRVASIDTDSRQQTFTHYVRNRRNWMQGQGIKLPHTTHYHLPLVRSDSAAERQRLEFELFRQALAEVERNADFLVIDTPGFDTNLSRLAHSMADTLITPVNDSLIDLNVIASRAGWGLATTYIVCQIDVAYDSPPPATRSPPKAMKIRRVSMFGSCARRLRAMCSAIAHASDSPSSVLLPRPISSRITKLREVAVFKIRAVSVISTMNVLCPLPNSSLAPTRA
jgi:hypothetical protein